jgi:hypothetical protein
MKIKVENACSSSTLPKTIMKTCSTSLKYSKILNCKPFISTLEWLDYNHEGQHDRIAIGLHCDNKKI